MGNNDYLSELQIITAPRRRIVRAMEKFYVHWSGSAMFVKEASFFESQGGLTKEWGKAWRGPIEAESIHAARMKGEKLFGVKLSDAAKRLRWLEENRPLLQIATYANYLMKCPHCKTDDLTPVNRIVNGTEQVDEFMHCAACGWREGDPVPIENETINKRLWVATHIFAAMCGNLTGSGHYAELADEAIRAAEMLIKKEAEND